MSAPYNSHELRILWNIKANEVLIEALKRSPLSEHNLMWLGSLCRENVELKSRSTLYEPFQLWVRKYNPDQPRVPAGNPDGGQWTDGGGAGGDGTDESVVGTIKKPASNSPVSQRDANTNRSETPVILAGNSGMPGDNVRANKQVGDVCTKLKLNKEQRKMLHDAVHGMNLSYQQVLKEAMDMFCL